MYIKHINFTKTNQYGCGPKNEDDVYTIEEFKHMCRCGLFIDYDGYGYPVKDSLADNTIIILPSKLKNIPNDATHIVWFNK